MAVDWFGQPKSILVSPQKVRSRTTAAVVIQPGRVIDARPWTLLEVPGRWVDTVTHGRASWLSQGCDQGPPGCYQHPVGPPPGRDVTTSTDASDTFPSAVARGSPIHCCAPVTLAGQPPRRERHRAPPDRHA